MTVEQPDSAAPAPLPTSGASGAVLVLGDVQVAAAGVEVFVDAARAAVVAAGRGQMAAPPRLRAPLGAVDCVITAGALADGTAGLRAYLAGAPGSDQVVVVWAPSGALAGLVVGTELGVRRTGALGAVAAAALALPDAGDVAVIGSGAQAWSQLWALASVRSLRSVRVHSPHPGHRRAFAQRAHDELGIEATAEESSSAAVIGADLVIAATRSTTPVLDVDDVEPGAHVVTVGPKAAGACEMPAALVERAAVITCDSPAQARAYPDPFFIDPARLVDLADVLDARAPGRTDDEQVTVHALVGLAGTEVAIAHALLDHHHAELARR